MKTVGIKNLRDSLSKYINMVKSGEIILITDNNKVVAEIIPSSGIESNLEILNKYINEQSKQNTLLKSTNIIKLKKKDKIRNYNKKILEKIYNETRDDR